MKWNGCGDAYLNFTKISELKQEARFRIMIFINDQIKTKLFSPSGLAQKRRK